RPNKIMMMFLVLNFLIGINPASHRYVLLSHEHAGHNRCPASATIRHAFLAQQSVRFEERVNDPSLASNAADGLPKTRVYVGKHAASFALFHIQFRCEAEQSV